jgi:hypothetical protein
MAACPPQCGLGARNVSDFDSGSLHDLSYDLGAEDH